MANLTIDFTPGFTFVVSGARVTIRDVPADPDKLPVYVVKNCYSAGQIKGRSKINRQNHIHEFGEVFGAAIMQQLPDRTREEAGYSIYAEQIYRNYDDDDTTPYIPVYDKWNALTEQEKETYYKKGDKLIERIQLAYGPFVPH